MAPGPVTSVPSSGLASPLTWHPATRRSVGVGLALYCSLFASAAVALLEGQAVPCSREPPASLHAYERVIDGDTLLLPDGEKLRLIGVNTPELGHGDTRDERGARAAARFVRDFLGGRRIGIEIGVEARDRYGRLLVHVYREDGASLEGALLASGMALRIVIPPNLSQLECHAAAEQSARERRAGLWASEPGTALDLEHAKPTAAGFRLLEGRVVAFRRSARAWWLQLEEAVSVRIDEADWGYFSERELRALVGRRIELRGWLVRKRFDATHDLATRWLLRLRHPAVLRPLPEVE